jgi:uncharacterized protein (DUF1330 family)
MAAACLALLAGAAAHAQGKQAPTQATGQAVSGVPAAAALEGRWESAPVQNPNDKSYARSVFELRGNQWTIDYTTSADPAGAQKLFALRVAGSYKLGAPVAGVLHGVEGDFERSRISVTAFAQPLLDMFNQAGCGGGKMTLGVRQDVTASGCAFVPSQPKCPREYDLVVFDGKTLSFGDRSGNMCALPRPTKVSAVSHRATPVFALIEVRVKDPAAFFGQYVPGHLPTVARYGGSFFLEMKVERPFGDPNLQGTSAAQLFIVQEWPSTLAFEAWWNSKEYAPWKEIRAKAAEAKLTLGTRIPH